jgi:hypothetical protein
MSLISVRRITLALVLAAFVSPPAMAQQAKVVKVSGKRAIVEFPDDAPATPGQVINLGGSSRGSGSGGSRNNLLGLGAAITMLTPEGGKGTTVISANGRYGWNMGAMEYGPALSLAMSSGDNTSSTEFGLGGFFDYNLVPNQPGTDMTYGLGIAAYYTSLSTKAGNSEGGSSGWYLDPGANIKYWALGNSVAIRADLVYRYQSVTAKGASKATTVSGLVLNAGLAVYF